MGFFKRLFSVSSKKNKNKHLPIVHNVPLPEQTILEMPAMNDEDHEVAVGRLLRSTSARFAEPSELNTLPPLPHPINNVIQTPASSCVSLASTSLSQRGTYNVTVHGRRRHASTEFPYANRHLEDNVPAVSEHGANLQPAEDSRVLRLRSDPSVASLLELYDEHGRLANDAFSNDSPPKQGRAQVQRNGSTLRQLLGAPSSTDAHDNSEGDISWAERFLAESETTSVNSSVGLQTPDNLHFPGELTRPEISFKSEADLSFRTLDNPAISSMEVEPDNSYDISQEVDNSYAEDKKSSPYMNPDPSTPQRASQVFGFLTKRSKPPADLDRTLPDVPSYFSSPSDEGHPLPKRTTRRDTSFDMSFKFPKRFSAPPPADDPTSRHTSSRPRSSMIENTPRPGARVSQWPPSTFSDDTHDSHAQPTTAKEAPKDQPSNASDTKQNDIRVLMTGPTKVIVTAPTPGTNHTGPSRLPRGPRAPGRKSSSSSVKRRRSVLGHVSSNTTSNGTVAGDPFVIVTSKPKPQQPSRRNSTSSIRSLRKEYDEHEDLISLPKNTRPSSPAAASKVYNNHKENQRGLSVKNDLPSTPLRTNSSSGRQGNASQSLFRTVVNQGMFRTPAGVRTLGFLTAGVPDPNSNSEMSPVGRQIMSDVRAQRTRARDAERVRVGSRF